MHVRLAKVRGDGPGRAIFEDVEGVEFNSRGQRPRNLINRIPTLKGSNPSNKYLTLSGSELFLCQSVGVAKRSPTAI
jgi:hypothetical protein